MYPLFTVINVNIHDRSKCTFVYYYEYFLEVSVCLVLNVSALMGFLVCVGMVV